MPKKIVIELEVKDNVDTYDVVQHIRNLLYAEHPWLPGHVFKHISVTDIKVE